MLEKQEFTGFWWLPEEPELKISGKLVLDPFKEAYIKLQYNLDQGEIWNLGEHFSLILEAQKLEKT